MTDPMTPEERAIKEFEEAFDITREEKNYLLELLRDERTQAAAEAMAERNKALEVRCNLEVDNVQLRFERDKALAQVAMLRETSKNAPCYCVGQLFICKRCEALQATEADVAAWLAEQKRQAVPQWLPIDTALTDGSWMLLIVPVRGICAGRYAGYPNYWVDHRGLNCIPTHWMPLPQPPQVEGGQGG